ncbi:MAG: hypothetical protein JXB05_24840 [Myxococcaceae bacterium]|nr:hypothetical protein [Myxococcaceae bacterium]
MRHHWIIGVAALAWVACSSDPQPDPPQIEPKATQVGTPIGLPETRVIGAAGGSLSSADGKLTLEIPAGALTQDETVGIQEITNEAHGKVGKAFRLTPEGVQFASPVTLRYHYSDEEVKGTVPALLSVAYQDQAGFWHVYKEAALDPVGKTVSVETRHFSDWSPVTGAQLLPHTASVHVSKTVDLRVVQCEVVNEEDDGSEAVITSILALCESSPLTSLNAKNWSVNGVSGGDNSVGTLQSNAQASAGLAVYSAPAQPPSANPVSVSVEYTEHFETTQHLLASNIVVVDPAAKCGGLKTTSTWNATFGLSFDYNGVNGDGETLTLSHFAEVTARLTKTLESESSVNYVGPVTGMVSVDDRHVNPGTTEKITTLKGQGEPVTVNQASRAYLNIDLTNCTYNVGMQVSVNAEYAETGSQPRTDVFPVGSVRSTWRPIGTTGNLTDGGDFVTHSDLWGATNTGDAYFQRGLGTYLFFDGYAAEGAAGSARVSWSYEPAP